MSHLFYLFRYANKLKKHFEEGVCINNQSQPTRLILKEKAFIPSKKLIDEMAPELTLVADTECYMKDIISE